MRLSTKGRYGLKAMYEVALHHGKGPVPLTKISENQKISLSYLEQLFAQLRKGKLVKSIRGAHGGYVLLKEPSEITVGDILNILEGSLAPVSCTDNDNSHCSNSGDCVTKNVWEKIHKSIYEVVDNITLQDMISENIGLVQLGKGIEHE